VSIDINNESGVSVDEGEMSRLARYVLDEMGINPLADLSVLIVDTEAMETLHVQWMDEPGPTDVLAFPMDELHDPGPGGAAEDDAPALLGDVVLCPQVAEKQAKDAGHSTADELHLLCTHGILHLLGYDHAEPEEEKEMFGLQAKLISGWQEQRETR
jgi:probable rRNA maturation factor